MASITKSREEILEWMQKYFTNYYDVHVMSDAPYPLIMRCDLHVDNQKYFLFKKNVVWSANCHEYVYIFSVPSLTEEVFCRCRDMAYEEGMKLVHPGKDHMYSYITCFIIADDADKQGEKAVKRCRIQKSFRFSLHGWMEFHTAALDRSRGRVYTNRGGREYAKLFKDFIH